MTFNGGAGVVVRSMVVGAGNATFDGINIDADNAQVLGVQFGGADATYKNASIGNVVDEKGMLATASCVGCTIDNVNFHDVLLVDRGIHNECLYSQAANITIKNSRFTNCATMDVFFTLGTWWGQPPVRRLDADQQLLRRAAVRERALLSRTTRCTGRTRRPTTARSCAATPTRRR